MFVVGLRAVAGAVQFFVEQVADAAAHGHSFVPVVAGVDAPDAVRSNLCLTVGQFSDVALSVQFDVVYGNAARFGAAVVGKGQVGVETFVRRPGQRAVDGVLRYQRQGVAFRIYGFAHVGEVIAPFQRVVQGQYEVAFDTFDGGFGCVRPFEQPVAVAVDGKRAFPDDDFIAVGVVEIGGGSLPAVAGEFCANFFVDAGFGFQVGVAHVVAAQAASACGQRAAEPTGV